MRQWRVSMIGVGDDGHPAYFDCLVNARTAIEAADKTGKYATERKIYWLDTVHKIDVNVQG